MEKTLLFALVIGLFSGLAIGLQGTFNSWAGRLIGPIGTGLLVNITGGVVAGLLLLFVGNRYIEDWGVVTGKALPFIVLSGILGVGIIAGVAFSLPRIGVAAGLSVLIFGQLLVGVIVDSLGLSGGGAIPLTALRVPGVGIPDGGRLVVAAAVVGSKGCRVWGKSVKCFSVKCQERCAGCGVRRPLTLTADGRPRRPWRRAGSWSLADG